MTSTYQTSSFGRFSQESPYRTKDKYNPGDTQINYSFRTEKQRTAKKNGGWNFGLNECNSSMVYSDRTSITDVKRSRNSLLPPGSDQTSIKDSMKEKNSGWIQLDKDSEISSWKQIQPEDKKFSNRYLYETKTCARYDLLVDYFRDMPVMTDKIKTPALLAHTVPQKQTPTKRSTLVQDFGMSRRLAPSEIEKQDNEKKEQIALRTCNKDGSPWSPNFTTERSELSWFRKHFKTNEPIVPPRKSPQTCVKWRMGLKTHSSKEANKFHPFGNN